MESVDKELLRRQISANNFIKNNGIVLTTINILRFKYSKLSAIESVFRTRGVSKSEFLDSVNFLSEEKYIRLREITTKEEVELADVDWDTLEAKLTGKGIRLLGGGIEDNMIEV
ncbi:MAG: type VI secretion protein [Bacillota bacterium]|nr:type VI secretion protein [Bacillota bacterium]